MATTQAQRLPFHTQSDVRRKVLTALQECGHPYVREVQVQAKQGHVTLEGIVCSYYAKQLAQAVSLSVQEVESLDNRLAVR